MLAGISIVVMLTALAPTLNGLKPDTALGKTLKAQGYVGVPIVQGKWSGWYYLNAKVDDVSTTFIIDTGAAHNCLSKELAIELGYKLDESTTRRGPFGQTIHEYGKAIPLLVVGGLEFGHGSFLINDMMTPEATRGDAMPKAGHGLLGAPFLTYFSAVIDYQSNTLYLLDPARRTKPLQGHWMAIVGEWQGQSYQVRSDVSLDIIGATATLSYKNTVTKYLLRLDAHGHSNHLNLIRVGHGVKPAIYKLDGNTLTIAGQLFDDNLPLAKRPQSFTTTSESRYAVMIFRKITKIVKTAPDRIEPIVDKITMVSLKRIMPDGTAVTYHGPFNEPMTFTSRFKTMIVTLSDGRTMTHTYHSNGSVEMKFGQAPD